jgi:hypothetical protein
MRKQQENEKECERMEKFDGRMKGFEGEMVRRRPLASIKRGHLLTQ